MNLTSHTEDAFQCSVMRNVWRSELSSAFARNYCMPFYFPILRSLGFTMNINITAMRRAGERMKLEVQGLNELWKCLETLLPPFLCSCSFLTPHPLH